MEEVVKAEVATMVVLTGIGVGAEKAVAAMVVQKVRVAVVMKVELMVVTEE